MRKRLFCKIKTLTSSPPKLVWTKRFYPPKDCFPFLTSKRLHWFAWQKKRNLIFCKIWIFKPYNENGLSLWCGTTEKDALENNGHEQARLFAKSFDASFRNTLATNRSVEGWNGLVKRKDNEIMKGEKHCQNKRQFSMNFQFSRKFCEII